MPVGAGYSPHIVFSGTEDYLAVHVLEVPKDTQQGQEFIGTIELMYPEGVDYSAFSNGAEFELLEGSRIVGSGKVEAAE
ncbi:hypothetical protein A7985_07435 [Pseudoalteromonas luteoviolacea]|uniref:Translation elongation factor EFTu/EF1A C-terminal domain-containing protein n=1 Tax=Pseudoalteromonas luteoviolacea TaxID=43657 RepID=A0A1C0TWR6_9GAMM|nr:hypothetical protein [Pseudoalteromonas luteoviolacea]OCQ23763.1 hypothetical protein A7985_07435 [Pseudoalteromonas luteoviolacea]